MSACTHVLGTDVALEVAGVCEHLEFETSAHNNCDVRRHQQRLFESLKFSVQFTISVAVFFSLSILEMLFC